MNFFRRRKTSWARTERKNILGFFSFSRKSDRIRRIRHPQRPQARPKIEKRKSIPKGIYKRRLGKIFSLIGVGVLLLVIIGMILGAVLFFTLFTIQNIELSRKDIRLEGSRASQVLAKEYAGRNIFLVQERSLRSLLQQYFPVIQELELQKKYPSTIRVSVSTYPVVLRWSCERIQKEFNREGEIIQKRIPETYSLNEKGIITRPNENETEAFIVYEKSECPNMIKNRDIILDPNIIESILNNKPLLEDALKKSVLRAGYYRDANEIHFYTEDETAVWVDFSTPIEKQIQKLKDAILLEPSLLSPMDHIDLRVNEKIFYAPKQ